MIYHSFYIIRFGAIQSAPALLNSSSVNELVSPRQAVPAAFAASMPLGASSTTMQSVAGMSSFAAAVSPSFPIRDVTDVPVQNCNN